MSDIIFNQEQLILSTTTTTATTEAAEHEIEKVFNHSPGSTWRSTVITVTRIEIDLGSPKNIKGVAYFGTNIEAGDTQFDLEGGVAAVTNDFSVALTKDTKGYKEVNETYRYWALEITKAAGTYIEIGKFMLCLGALTATRNMNRGWKEKKRTVFTEVTSKKYGWGARTANSTKQIFKNMFFEFVDNADKVIYDEIISADPESAYYNDLHDKVYFGWFRFPDIGNKFIDLWNIPASFEEML